MNSYELSRQFWDWAFDNPSKVKPIHCAIYFFAVEHCNRLGWKREFGMPTSMVIEAIGIKSYKLFRNAFDELINWGLIILIERSKNQYSSNIIALSLKSKAQSNAPTKALSKALSNHGSKHGQYIKTKNNITNNQKQAFNESSFTNAETKTGDDIMERLKYLNQ
jgi:hypothetical protein